jgi:hypothetical protein
MVRVATNLLLHNFSPTLCDNLAPVRNERTGMAIPLRSLLVYAIVFTLLVNVPAFGDLTTLNNNDPYPIYTSADPHDLLTMRYKNTFKDYGNPFIGDRLKFSLSVFRQSANRGTGINDTKFTDSTCAFMVSNPCKNSTPLGDLKGRWNMLSLFYDPVVAATLESVLGIPADIIATCSLNQPAATDVNKEYGFFSVPITYRKFGIRFEADLALSCDMGLRIQGGVADIRQTASFNDLTCTSSGLSCISSDPTADIMDMNSCFGTCCIDTVTCSCKKVVIDDIMKKVHTIACNLGMNIRDFHEFGIEDLRIGGYLRHVFVANEDRPSWPLFLFTPFFTFDVSIPLAQARKFNHLFSLGAGNNHHTSAGFTTGFSIDFVETVEIAFEAGLTSFFRHTHNNYPVPTNGLQAGMFPRLATVEIKPGSNWHFGATLNAYYFLDRLSVFAQYLFINHDPDCFSVQAINPLLTSIPDTDTPANILAGKLREESKWEVQVINVGANYDIAPQCALGFIWQAPLSRRNAYRSTTIMGSIVFTF